jgi:hypothetical protein
MPDLPQTFAPVAWPPFGVHDGHNPDVIWFVEVDHRIRESPSEGALGWRTESKETVWPTSNLGDEPFDFVVEPHP